MDGSREQAEAEELNSEPKKPKQARRRWVKHVVTSALPLAIVAGIGLYKHWPLSVPTKR